MKFAHLFNVVSFLTVHLNGQLCLYTTEIQKRGFASRAHSSLSDKRKQDNIRGLWQRCVRRMRASSAQNNVTSNMIHGPCDDNSPSAVCMKNGSCSKGFPKPYLKERDQRADSYSKYRKRNPQNGGHCKHFGW